MLAGFRLVLAIADAAITVPSTPYVMLTNIPGIGFVLAAGLAGELGDPKNLLKLNSLCAYAGIVPRIFQSGGPDSPSRQCLLVGTDPIEAARLRAA